MTRAFSYWPWMLAPATAFAAALFSLGGDTGPAPFLYSGLLLSAAAVAAATRQIRLGAAGVLTIAIYIAYLLVGAAKGWLASGAPEYAALAGAGAIFLIGRAGARVFERGEVLWRFTLSLFAVIALIGFADHIVDPGFILGTEKAYHETRLTTPFLSANTAATFYGIGAIAALAAFLRALRERGDARESRGLEAAARRLLMPTLALVITLTCLVLTQSRAGALIGLGAAAGLLAWDSVAARRRSGRAERWAPALILLAAAAGVLISISAEGLGERLERVGADSSQRLDLAAAYVDAVRYAPVFGHGPGGFEYVNDLAADASNAERLTRQNAAHNVVLQWLLQAGVVGTAIAGGILIAITNTILSGLGARRRARSFLRAGLAIFALVFAHGMVDYALEIPAFLWVFAWLAGLCAGFAQPADVSVRPGPGRALSASGGFAALAALCLALTVDRVQAEALAALKDEAALAALDTGPPALASVRRLEAYADLALRRPATAPAARSALERVVSREPRDGAAWARLAYAQALDGDRQAAAEALAHSYDRKPYGRPEFSVWRIDLAIFIWPGLDDRTRNAALREARTSNDVLAERLLERTGACVAEPPPAACFALER